MLSHLQFARLYAMPGAARVLVPLTAPAPPAETRYYVTWRRRDGRYVRSAEPITLADADEYTARGESIVAAEVA
jgi:hypothetical protein